MAYLVLAGCFPSFRLSSAKIYGEKPRADVRTLAGYFLKCSFEATSRDRSPLQTNMLAQLLAVSIHPNVEAERSKIRRSDKNKRRDFWQTAGVVWVVETKCRQTIHHKSQKSHNPTAKNSPKPLLLAIGPVDRKSVSPHPFPRFESLRLTTVLACGAHHSVQMTFRSQPHRSRDRF